MKRIKMFIVLILSVFIVTPSVYAVETGGLFTGDDALYKCTAFASTFTNIREEDGNTFYYKKCYWARCNSGQYGLINQAYQSGYRCMNGNSNPYTTNSSDGCSSFKGACSKDKNWGQYCGTVTYVDCGRNANGSAYVTTTVKATETTTAQVVTTTTAKKTSTQSKAKTTKKRTTLAPFTNETTKATTTVKTTETTTQAIPNNANIKEILVNNTKLGYTKSKDTYTIKIPMDVTEVDVSVELVEPNDSTTVAITGNKDMPNEETEIKIEVTAAGGAKKNVTLKVKRYTGESSDCTLANIHMDEYDLDFDKSTYDYKLKVKKSVTSLDLEVLPTDEMYATYEILNNEKLKNNSVVDIKVRAQDGTECVYTIKIQKSNNLWKYVVLIVLLVGALVFASVTLYKYLKKSKGKYKYE